MSITDLPVWLRVTLFVSVIAGAIALLSILFGDDWTPMDTIDVVWRILVGIFVD